jgi:hypothetical protein
MDPGASSENCGSWVTTDEIVCDAVGVDEIVFNLNEGGSNVVSIELRVFRSELQQVGYVNRTGWTNGQDDLRGLYAGRMTCGICNTLGMKALNCFTFV